MIKVINQIRRRPDALDRVEVGLWAQVLSLTENPTERQIWRDIRWGILRNADDW